MANFVISRARRLFSYSDLGGTNGSTMDLEASPNSTVTEVKGIFKQRKKCVLVFTAIFGLMVVIIIGMSSNSNHVKSAIKNLPEAFRSASSSIDQTSEESRRVSLRDTSYGMFYAAGWNGTWISGKEFMYSASDQSLNIYNMQANNSTQIFSADKMRTFAPYQTQLSSDKKYLLLKTSNYKVFRRSTYGTYDIISLENHTMDHLHPSNWSSKDSKFLIRYVSWAPQGNGLVYVDFNNNIYYRESVMSQDTQITDDGQAFNVFNGIPDWVFEEEVFEDNKALWWSPDATKLVYGSFNDTEVDTYLLQSYGQPDNLRQYPDLLEVRYPKVGRVNPVSALWMTDLQTGAKTRILPPRSMDHEEVHFSQVTWADSGNNFAVTWFNRVQNRSVITLCNVNDLDCSDLDKEIFKRDEQNGWVPYKYKILFNPTPPNPKNRDFVTILPAQFLVHKYRQLVYITGDKRQFLTRVNGSEVTEILKWKDGFVYYMATVPDKPGTRHLYKVRAPPEVTKGVASNSIECLTCNRTMPEFPSRDPCQYYDVKMSLDGSFMTMICQGPDIPYACIHSTTVPDRNILTFETNSRIESTLQRFDMPTLEFREIPVSDSDQRAQVRLMLPPDFDPAKKYPMVVYAYGGPGYQAVDQKFNWNEIGTYLAGSKDVIYATVDPKGSGYQGEDWRQAVYHNFGTAEVQSLTEVTRHLQANLDYIDADKVGVWGWSYGGYLSLMSLSKDTNDTFKCGASVAPVADWTLYDTYYTERYMGLNTENDNADGYKRSSAFQYLENLRTKKYFLLHGTHDDNVHYQNSMLLSAKLEEKDILFRQQAYPDQDHSISRYRTHLDHSLVNFFLSDCFKLDDEKR